ncbi:MAG TPA: SgcJ/EcaC family oxidoreductase [Pyrinomonadaceae bacterium]|nr:SgcJ/EcaC family oxidoreductase [Pyrinomonadaceae bacterium]
MSQRIKILALIVAAFVSLAGSESRAQTAQKQGADEASVRRIVQQLQDGWNAHDGRAFAAPFAADADYVVVNGMKLNGREAIEKGHTGIFTTIYKESKNAATIKSIRFLRSDVAVAHVEWNLEFRIGGETRKAQAMSTLVLTKEGGKWSIAAFQNTPVQTEGR